MAGLDRIVQQDFSAGMFPAVAPEHIPANGAEDITNGLLDDQGACYRRGGCGLVVQGLTGLPRMLWAGYLGGAYREVIITSSRLYTDGGFTNVGAYAGMVDRPLSIAVLDDTMYLPGGYIYDGTTLSGPGLVSSDGDRIAAVAGRILLGRADRVKFSVLLHTGTGNTTSGSATIASVVTTAGEFQVDAAIYGDGIPAGALIATIVGTNITLKDAAGAPLNATKTATGVALSSTARGRRYAPTDYHRFPAGATVTGIVGLRDRAAVFTTQGLWLISNLAANLTDADGNVQQRLDQYSPSLWLWNDTDAGVCAYEGALVVPAVDGVWLLALGVASEAPQPQQLISRPIANLYRSYFTAGYKPGQATIFANHYLLPILNGAAVVDVLVCRLDATDSRGRRTFPWTHLKGSRLPASLNPAPFAGTSWGSGLFLHGLVPVTGSTTVAGFEYFGADPQGTQHTTDLDGTVHQLDVTTRTFEAGDVMPGTVERLSVGYLMASGASTATLTAEVAPGPTSAFTSLTGSAPETGEEDPYTWSVRKRTRWVRFRLRSGTGTAPTSLSLRRLAVWIRSSGRG